MTMTQIPEIFGSKVFDDRVMKEYFDICARK